MRINVPILARNEVSSEVSSREVRSYLPSHTASNISATLETRSSFEFHSLWHMNSYTSCIHSLLGDVLRLACQVGSIAFEIGSRRSKKVRS